MTVPLCETIMGIPADTPGVSAVNPMIVSG
jgi:hypothetical protein